MCGRARDVIFCRKSLGTHRFKRAVVEKGVLIGIISPPKSSRMCWAIIVCARAHPAQARCGHPMSLLPETARWSDAYPGAIFILTERHTVT